MVITIKTPDNNSTRLMGAGLAKSASTILSTIKYVVGNAMKAARANRNKKPLLNKKISFNSLAPNTFLILISFSRVS